MGAIAPQLAVLATKLTIAQSFRNMQEELGGTYIGLPYLYSFDNPLNYIAKNMHNMFISCDTCRQIAIPEIVEEVHPFKPWLSKQHFQTLKALSLWIKVKPYYLTQHLHAQTQSLQP